MSNYQENLKKELKIYFNTIKEDFKNRRDPDFFQPFGTQIHCGRQGSGKTISAVHVVNKIKARYPKAILVSNLSLSGYRAISTAQWLCYNVQNPTEQGSSLYFDSKKDYIHFSSLEDLHQCLVKVNNGKYGVIYLIDEIHTYFNALDSKNIPIHIFTEISQQRKQRKLIVGTSQLFMRLAKPFREQCDNIIMCNTSFNILTSMVSYDGMSIEQARDGSLIGTPKKRGFFFHSKKDRNSYDTFQKVISSNLQYENSDNPYVNKKQAKNFNKDQKKEIMK